MIDAALVERYVRDANPIPHVDDLDTDELAHAVAVTHARREAAMQTPTQTPTRPTSPAAPPTRRRVWAFALGTVLVLAGIGITALVLRDGRGTVTNEPAAPTTVPETPTSVPETATEPIQVESLTWAEIESLSWSRAPDTRSFADMAEIGGVTVGGPGLVAVGRGFWVSEDGMTWTRVHPELTGNSYVGWGGVTAGGPGLVAVGTHWDEQTPARAAVWTSPDGLDWSRVAHDEEVFGLVATSESEGWLVMTDVTVGGPGLVAVGWESEDTTLFLPAVWTSPDGVTWSRVPYETDLGQGRMVSVTTGGPGLVAVGVDDNGFNAAVWTSPNGFTWSRVPHHEGIFGSGPTGDEVQAMWGVITGGPGLVAIGEEEATMGASTHAAVWTSPDGITWSRVPHDEDIFGFGPSFSGDGKVLIESVIDVGGGLVAVGSAPRCEIDWETEPFEPDQIWSCHHAVVWTSPDGLTWSRAPHNEEVFVSGEMGHVVALGRGLVALGGVEIYPDGPVYVNGEAYDNGGMVWVAIPTE